MLFYKDDIDTLILSGGGVKGIALLGSLSFLNKNTNLLSNVKNFYGCSVGACINFFLILGFSPEELLIEFISNDHRSNLKVNIINGFTGKGFIKFSIIEQMIREITLKKISFIPTLAEINKLYNVNYKAVCFNFTDKKEEVLDHLTHPDLNIIDCLRMTCNLPFVFNPFFFKNKLYYDGFLTNNFPISLVEDHNKAIGISTQKLYYKNNKNLEKIVQIWEIISIPFKQMQNIKHKKYYTKMKMILYLTDIDLSSMKYMKLNTTDILSVFEDAFENTKLNLSLLNLRD